MKLSQFRYLPFLLLFLLLFGCGGTKGVEEYKREGVYSKEVPAAPEMAKSAAPGRSLDSSGAEMPDSTPAEVSPGASPPEKAEERKRIYSGYSRLMVDDVEEQKENISRIAEESGGYVESVYESTIIIRIPAESFDIIFSAILKLGEIINKSIETYDVTEYFRDLAVRLEIAEKTRTRLYVLLEKTDDVKERLSILREIKRLTEEIERIKLTLELLERQIAFSRITIELVPRLPVEEQDRQSIPFYWIANLRPLYPSLGELKGKIDFELSDDFAVFTGERIFRAESPDGIRVRVSSTENQPEGDSLFWQNALSFHLGKFYRETEELEFEDVQAVLFLSKDRKPFYYLVGVAVEQETLFVIEVFFPDEAIFKENIDVIKEAFAGFGLR